MATATHPPHAHGPHAHGHSAHGETGHHADSVLASTNDPLHDIDAKNTVIVLIVSTIFVFGTVWLLYYLFAWVMHNERIEVVERAPTLQLDQLRNEEARLLQAGDDPKRKSIEDSIRELSSK